MTDLTHFFNLDRPPNGGFTGQQTTFDINEFPSLSKMSLLSQMQASSRTNYVNIAKDNTNNQTSVDSTQNEFTISSEDFPALPGSNDTVSTIGTKGPNGTPKVATLAATTTQHLQDGTTAAIDQCGRDNKSYFSLRHDPSVSPPPATNNTASTTGVEISNDGRVTNIPSCMVTDQFGMIGLLAFLRAAETDPNLASVTFGTDLTALGLNLTAQDKLYPSFAGPWSDQALKVYEIDYPAPPEYLVSSSLRDKLSQITLKRYHEDTIFFLFYMFPNDMLQLAAALELFNREWRYHKEEKVWITRAPGIGPSEKTPTYERGTYFFFDPLSWRRVPREFYLEYDRLENKPNLP